MARVSMQRLSAGGKVVSLDTTSTKPRRVKATLAAVQDPVQLVRLLEEIQQATSDATAPGRSLPFLGGVWIRAVVFGTGAAATVGVAHGLGRAPQGFLVTDLTAAATIYRSAASDARTLTLTASAACTADLYVW